MKIPGNPQRWVVAACALVAASLLAAQQPPAEDAQAKKFYEDLIRTPIVPQRSAEDIQDDLNAAEKRMQQTDKAIDQAKARIKESEGWITTQKSEQDALKAKINAAKKEKREPDKLALEAQQKQLELVEDYLKKWKAIREAELDVAQAQKDLLNSEMKVYRSESDLKNKVDRIKTAGPQDPNLGKIVLDATQTGEDTLKAMETMASKNEDVAGRMKRLAERRLELAQARNKLMSEDRIRGAAASMQK